MIITSHFLDQAASGSVPPEMVEALRASNYPANSAVVLGRAPSTNAMVIAIIRAAKDGSGHTVATTCITRHRAFAGPETFNVKYVYELKE